ncbi:MAG: type II secretion system protein [Pseudomonadota bacterium]
MNSYKGFTLIELIVVITVLGILVSVAAPRFVALQSDARKAVMQGVEASLRGAATLVYSKALIEGKEATASGQSITVENASVSLVYGYPSADSIAKLITIEKNGNIVFGAPSTGKVVIEYTNANQCTVTYYEATSLKAATVTGDYSSC